MESRKWTLVLACLFALTLFAGCGKSTGSKKGAKAFTPNMGIFYAPEQRVWDELIKILKYDLLYSLDVVDRRGRRFSSAVIRDYQPEIQIKYRVSGSVNFEGEGVVVVLYNQIQVRQNEGWIARPSDFSVERQILNKLRERLGN